MNRTQSPPVLRVGTFNIANGSRVGHDMAVLARDLRALSLDIVGLQEVDRFAARSRGIDTVKALAELADYPHTAYAKAISLPGIDGREGEYGIAILSRYPIDSAEVLRLESGGKEQRVVLSAQVRVDGVEVSFFNTHLSFEDPVIRAGQFETLAALTKEKPYTIVTGDFNIGSFDDYAPVGFLSKTAAGMGDPVTFPGGEATIDNILFSDGLRLAARGTAENAHSDHYLLWAELCFSS